LTVSAKAAFTGLGLLSAAVILAGPCRAAPERPVLVELFTSQGCASCPPAETLLGDLAKRPNVLALAWHVDYWDGLGWKDKFSFHDATQRQFDYSERLGRDNVYTPQLVVDGDSQAIGWDASAAARLIHAAASHPVVGPSLTLDQRPGGTTSIAIGAGSGAGTVWLVDYDRAQTTPIGRGENAGQTLTQYQVVRTATKLGAWHGAALDLPLPAKSAQGEVVFIEPDGHGPMLATLAVER
jgi:hypothetical protein